MFQNKIVKYLAIVTLVLFILGCVMLTIGMVAKVTYVNTGFLGGTEKWSVSSWISEINRVSVDKINLFSFHNDLIDVISYIDNHPIESALLFTADDLNFLNKMLTNANVAIAGFSFIIISIAAAIATIVAGKVLNK